MHSQSMSDAHGLNPGFLRMAHELRNMILALFPLAGKPDARHSSSPAISRSKLDARASCRSAASARTAVCRRRLLFSATPTHSAALMAKRIMPPAQGVRARGGGERGG